MGDLLTNDNIVALLDDSLDVQHADSLAYSQVFPYEYIPETVQEGRTFICFDVDVQESVNKTYLLPTLFVWVFTHKSKLRLSEGGVRTDKLCSEICQAINGSRNYGLGELNLYSVKRFAPMTDYQGKVLVFHAKDFNRQYDPTKPIPSNRKQG
jgi:hypothetical protein